MRVGLLSLVLLVMPAAAAAGPSLADGEPGVAAEIVDGDTLVLEDGREVRLVGIQAPKLPLGRAGFKAWPLAGEAKAALAELAQGKRLRLAFGGRRLDRHGRLLAHLFDLSGGGEGRWLQGEMVRRGLARVYSFRDNRALVAELLALEAEARAARRGIWRLSFYRPRDAAEAGRYIGGFELVEGRVVKAAEVRGRVYLNFGQDWRQDFTATISPGERETFAAAGVDLLGLAGRRVRVRGWLKSYNGPMIEVTHPEQIEVIGE